MNNRGMVLITVLWAVLIISLLAFSLAASVRVEAEAELNSTDSERAFYMAKGAAEVVYARFAAKEEFPKDSRVVVGNGKYVFPFDAGQSVVQFESSDGLIDLNAASDVLLASVFDSLGVSEEQRNRIVDSILDWRDSDDMPHLYGAEVDAYLGSGVSPRNGAFQNLDELLLVKNMIPEVFYGTIKFDESSGQYRHVPGVRDLLTVSSERPGVNPNVAPEDVLRALPGMTNPILLKLLEERAAKRFASIPEIQERIPEMKDGETLKYLNFEAILPSALVSRATISASGVSRTVRILFRQEEKLIYVSVAPILAKREKQAVFDRWQYQ